MRDERGEPVVVAVADLVVGDGVVLVHHRHHAELEQSPERLARVQVLRPLPEVVRRQQHLPGDEVVLAEDGADPLHETRLPDRSDRLQRPDVGRACRHPEWRQSRRDGTRAHQHDLVAVGARARDLATQLHERAVVELASFTE